MGLHVYCIVAPAVRPVGVRGIDNVDVERVESGGIAAWASAHETRPPSTIDAIRCHNAVIMAALHDDHTPVPLRFGQWFEDPATLRGQLLHDPAQWQQRLDRLAGCVEYAVRIGAGSEHATPEQGTGEAGTGAASLASTPGHAYLDQVARRVRREDADRERASEALADLKRVAGNAIRDEQVRTGSAGELEVAHLVRRTEHAAYQHALDVIRAGRPALRLLSTGPWPPYSFAA